MPATRVFVSFDVDHDVDLHDQLVDQSHGSSFEVSGCSEAWSDSARWESGMRSRIAEADEVIILCGEHTDASRQVDAEVRAAHEQDKPCLLVWGRRERMCTRPTAANRNDSMYSWTPEILTEQIAASLRKARPATISKYAKQR